MISINKVYNTIKAIINTNVRGNIDPETLRLHINQAVNEIREEYFLELNRAVNRENRGLVNIGGVNISNSLREKIMYFYKETTYTNTNTYTLPEDLMYLDNVHIEDNEVEIFRRKKEYNLVKHRASFIFPIGYIGSSEILITPPTTKNVTIGYLRKHKLANWTYVVIDGTEIFNPSSPDFADIDLHSSEEYNVIVKTLKYNGLNLREQDVQAFALRDEQNNFQQDINN